MHTIRPLTAAAALGTLLLAAAPAALHAQVTSGLRAGIAAGANLPADDFGDGAKTGMIFQGWVGLGLGSFGLRAEAHYSRSDIDAPLIRRAGNAVLPEDGIGETSGNVDILGLTLNGVLGIPAPVVSPYLIGGVGWYSRNVEQDVQSDLDEFRNLDRDDSDFGWNAGVGISFPFLIGRGYLEGRYHSVDSPQTRTTFVPVVFGIVF